MTQRRLQSLETSVIPPLLTTTIASTCILYWLSKVNTIVPDAYLDEVFHVRQAQTYWRHQWRQWDPKITTPPGLYLFSYLVGSLGFLVFRKPVLISAAYLRSTNALVLFISLPFLLRRLLKGIRKLPDSQCIEKVTGDEKGSDWDLNLTVLNICLFPPILFFSGLYYTDLAALFIMLEVYRRDLERTPDFRGRPNTSIYWKSLFSRDTITFTLFGLISLLLRQTNIFWAAVFLGGLRVVRTLHSLQVDCQSTGVATIVEASWGLQQIYDPPVSQAFFEDYFKTCLSIGVAALANVRIILTALLPYLGLLAAFGLFILWNGSVVLGHKEFHTASLHFPQMLYIWAYFMFFSWPIIIAPLAVSLSGALSSRNGMHSLFSLSPRPHVAACFIALMLLAVHFNTIVHPFTLADNRHYVFYVFRILLRKPFIKYAVTPAYFLCGWAAISSLGGPSAGTSGISNKLKSKGPDATKYTKESPNSTGYRPELATGQTRVSFVLIWLASTTLCLITAPLVEPRYFIIPWVLWRLHVPSSKASLQSTRAENEELNTRSEQLFRYVPLILEGIWYIAINGVTGYMFLYKGFEWPQEPGLMQRFMW